MAFDKLPEEILIRILSFLPRSDLLESALTCRRWAQAVAASPLLRNIWLVIEDMKEAETVFANSHRQYQNLRLYGGDSLDFTAAFWTKVGPSLRNLEIRYWSCSSEVFHSILQACCNLESLRLGIDGFALFKPELPSGMDVRSIQKSMRNLHHLDLDFDRLHEDTVEYLLVLMPNVSSVSLSLLGVESSLLSRLGTSRRVTIMELESEPDNGEEFEQLLRTSSASLRKLDLDSGIPTRRVFETFSNCTMLRDFSIYFSRLDAHLLKKILGYVPQLESLVIGGDCGAPLSRGDLVPISDLKKLRKLHFDLKLETDSTGCLSKEFLREIARISSLETLDIQNGAVDSTGFQILASLPKLRDLEVEFIERDAGSFRTILFASRKLRTLSIQGDSFRERRFSRPVGNSEVDRNSMAFVDRFGTDQEVLEFSSLEVLEFRAVPLTDACLGDIAAHHTRLKVLFFEHCYFITDAGLVTLLRQEPLLEELELAEGNNLNGEFLQALGELPCCRLRSLKVHTRNAIRSQAQEAFKSRMPRVKCRFSYGQ